MLRIIEYFAKSLKITQDHLKWYHSNPSMHVYLLGYRFLFALYSNYGVSLAVCEIFSVKKWRDFKIWVRGRSKSLIMAPFARPYGYDFLSVLHCNYSSILYHFSVIWCWIFHDLEIRVRGHSKSLKLVPFEILGTVFYSPFIVTMVYLVSFPR